MTNLKENGIFLQKKQYFKNLLPDSIRFPLLIGLFSRGLIAFVMLGVAPLLAAPSGGIKAEFGWKVFSAWDSNFYQQIATTGYEILPNNQPGANVAFFPLYPLLIRLLMGLGVSTEVAGTLINHLAFFVTLIVLYDWTRQHHGEKAAKWATIVLAGCPLSLFGSVVYSEGIFLLFSTLALRSFDNQRFWFSAVWGSLTTAARITGLALIPAFLLTAFVRKYPLKAYFASFLSGIGVGLYGLYCWLQFRDPMAFITVQHTQWERSRGFDWVGWGRMIVEIVAGGANWNHGGIKDPTHPIIFGVICLIGYALWHFRAKLSKEKLDYGFFTLFFILWLLVGDPLLNTLSIVGGMYLLWHLRRELSLVAVSYGFCALGLLLASGGTSSLNRYVYGIISLSLALGVFLSRHRRWGYAMIGFFVILLVSFAIRFAQHLWVA